ncbi:mercury methylation ferredoxin HgcB [Desulfobaculum bizertense]|uniref:4Fe-4S dicluster domain-containing protein n=1 Tax=Desulfobaculum bizertense DSM 18034 TaxID=1121442 RepID=A0A1T4VFL1_9BACT|nr:mercury methylation ferredoxin HgcB [Desulfobaculum bizertense]UIJ37729.1 4Fe-4S binding protein [Desulfobaculum bizertense]SKA63693.1 4Fe-4S dicluster domain-containing protein [Desulfobaculum bizertense DSM 18034]
MEHYRYIPGVVSLNFDEEACTGCGLCVDVCPHRVFEMINGKARLRDRDGCVECGACAKNCEGRAIRVDPGVGCAVCVIKSWLWSMGLRVSRPSCR